MMTRRQALRHTLLTTVACSALSIPPLASAQPALPPPAAPAPTGPHKLPPLSCPFDALEPFIDARTMEIHHGKHHAAYVGGLNKVLVDHPELAAKSVEDLLRDLAAVPEKARTAVRNHGGGHANHSLFWKTLKKNHDVEPKGAVAKAIERRFKSLASFRDEFTKAALGLFGSGWVWVSLEGKELRLETTPNQDSPLSQGRQPLFGLDVWEHAYYLKYQNRRSEYAAAFFFVVNWDFVAERYETLTA